MPKTTFSTFFFCAGVSIVFFTCATAAKDDFSITELDWTDKRQMTQQVEAIDGIARKTIGGQVSNDKTDLRLLQNLVSKSAIAKTDRLNLQGMGVVLGNLMAQEFGLEWRIYKDAKGRNRALCDSASRECLFPITMLSRRIEVGLIPNVEDIYNNAHELINPYLKKQSPYSVN